MTSDSDIHYPADLRLPQDNHTPLECVRLNDTQYVCQTVQSPAQALVDRFLTDGILAVACIVVLTFLALISRRRQKDGRTN